MSNLPGIIGRFGHLGRFAQRIGSEWRRLNDAWLMQNCALCSAGSASGALCPDCFADLPRLAGPCCAYCALPLRGVERAVVPERNPICGRCLHRPPHFDATLACYRYAFPVDRLIQALKYAHHLNLAGFFAGELAGLAQKHGLAGQSVDSVVPLPLSRERLIERGFNQALEIARPLAGLLGCPVTNGILQRIKHGTPQASLPLRERRRNVRGSFACNSDLTGRTIVLVDDVMTSGSTLDEAARTLKLHGANRVIALILARAERN